MVKTLIIAMIIILSVCLTCLGQTTTPLPGHLSYSKMVQLLQKWEQETPKLVRVASIGNTKKGIPIYAMRLTNEKIDVKYKKRVLIAMTIHGNEPLAAAVGMGWVGFILSHHKKNGHEYIDELLDKREVYFIPLVSPDSFPRSRHVEGVDPNRDFYKEQPCYPVRCLKRFASQLHFDAVLSGHSAGRVLLYPYGDLSLIHI